MTFNADFQWCGRADVQLAITYKTRDRIAVRDTLCTDVRTPTVVPVIPVVARRPGQSDLICLHVHPHIRLRQRLSGRAGVFDVGR